MSASRASHEYLLNIISMLQSYYDEAFPGRDEPGLEFITGGAPSRNPRFCYCRWLESSSSLLFEGVTRSDIEEAFSLWLGVSNEESESSSNASSPSQAATLEAEDYDSSDSESESEEEESTSHQLHEAAAVHGDADHDPSTFSAASPCTFVDAQTDSSSSSDDEDESCSNDDDDDDDWRPSPRPSRRHGGSLGSPSPSAVSAGGHPLLLTRDDDNDEGGFRTNFFDDSHDDHDGNTSASFDPRQSPPPESLFDLEGTPSEFTADVTSRDFAGTSELVESQSSSSEFTSVEAKHDSKPSPRAHGKKRARDEDGDSDYTSLGPSTKKKSVRLFACTLGDCIEAFPNKSALNRHIESSEAHATRAFKCPGSECKFETVRASAFYRHYDPEKHATCRDALRVKANLLEWTTSTPKNMLESCKVPHTPKAGPSRKRELKRLYEWVMLATDSWPPGRFIIHGGVFGRWTESGKTWQDFAY
ncbi:hypothetical protein FOMPIDRAFT_116927 [Fomitopsis schrenkii]|uniref:C2H2-type domain-containing protein n=1 Tax=Fomitopsis schrenkii TaxID=2126942 RepID=S8DVR7_FOMSC|nr:hypothetical protein FOMPIDRAFT_116927 [Fomitopsis schrenkii]